MKLHSFLLLTLFPLALFAQDGFVGGGPRLAWWSVGNGKEIVVMLHGGPAAGHGYLRPEWDALTATARVIYYDQRGCGASGSADCMSWHEHVNDLKRLTDTLAPGRPVILAASSWGTHLALLFAYQFPSRVRGMILSGTFPWMGKGVPPSACPGLLKKDGTPYFDHDSFFYGSVRRGYRINNPPPMSDSFARRIREDKLIELHTRNRVNTMASLATAPPLARLNALQVPILIFEGKPNCAVNGNFRPPPDGARQLANVLPRSRVYPVLEYCHDPWMTHPELFFREANAFIRGL